MHGARVLVTGANGHLGYTLCALLREHGYTVHAAVRDTSAEDKVAPLHKLGVHVVKADILDHRDIDAAVKAVDAVFHVAAVHAITANDPIKEIYRPNVDGTLNVVHSCARHGITKLILTSSAAAVGTVMPGEAPRDESSWNHTTADTYLQAKVEAENKAWKLAMQNGLKMVSILPAALIGPGFHRHTPTTSMIDSILTGKIPCRIPLQLNVVDVRDVAAAHLMAFESPSAAGRYLCTNWFGTLSQLIHQMKTLIPDVNTPRCAVPSVLMPLLCKLDAINSRITSSPRVITRALYEDYGRRIPLFDSCRIRSELGWRPRKIQDSLADTVSWMQQTFMQNERYISH